MSDTPIVHCSYCQSHGNQTPAVVGMAIPHPNGEIPVHLCRRHLDMLVTELTATQRRLDGAAVSRLVVPPKRRLRLMPEA